MPTGVAESDAKFQRYLLRINRLRKMYTVKLKVYQECQILHSYLLQIDSKINIEYK